MVAVPVRKSWAWKRPEVMSSKARRAVAGVWWKLALRVRSE